MDLVHSESQEKNSTQLRGGPLNHSGKGLHDSDPVPTDINQISFSQKLIPTTTIFPAQDWYIVESVTSRHLSKSPRITFKILGWVCLIGQKWHDIVRIKKWKQTNKLCVHPHIFCRCAILFLNQQNKCDRPFPPDFVLNRVDNKFLQVSDKSEELLTNTGLKIASILCADI